MPLKDLDAIKLRILWTLYQLGGRANLSKLMKKGSFCVGMFINNVNVLIEKDMVRMLKENSNIYEMTEKGLKKLKKCNEKVARK